MFEDSLIESGGKLKTTWAYHNLLLYFEAVIVGVMVLIPLIFTEACPSAVNDVLVRLRLRRRHPRRLRRSSQDRETGAD